MAKAKESKQKKAKKKRQQDQDKCRPPDHPVRGQPPLKTQTGPRATSLGSKSLGLRCEVHRRTGKVGDEVVGAGLPGRGVDIFLAVLIFFQTVRDVVVDAAYLVLAHRRKSAKGVS